MPFDANEIEVITSVEAIRRRPHMYLGALDDPSILDRLTEEALCLAIDEAMSGCCSTITLTNASGGLMTIRDNGRGLPMEPLPDGKVLAEVLLTQLYACRDRKENQSLQKTCCHVGLVVVNAMSEYLRIRNFRDGFCWAQESRCGVALAPFVREFETTETGVELSFRPDTSIFGEMQFDPLELVKWVHSVGLNFESLRIGFGNSWGRTPLNLLLEGLRPAELPGRN
jgi:DNA gyrase subunit B